MDLKTYLERSDGTMADFAARVGTTTATVSRIARREFRPSLKLAHAIESASLGQVPTEEWLKPVPTPSASL